MNWIPFNPDWQPSPEPARPTGSPSKVEPETKPEKYKVVVAEDDPVSREVVCTLLRNWGFEVFVTQNGLEAIEALRSQTTPVLAVLDWMMPELDGLEVCRRVRELDKLVYILLLTARTAKEQLVEGLQAGADDYLVKPFNKEELHARLKAGLRVLSLQAALTARVKELEEALEENRHLRLRIPI